MFVPKMSFKNSTQLKMLTAVKEHACHADQLLNGNQTYGAAITQLRITSWNKAFLSVEGVKTQIHRF